MRTFLALAVIASVAGCAVAFDLDPVQQAQRERLLQPEIVRVPTGQKETWSPPPVALDDGPSGLADARLPLERLLPSALRGRAATEEPEAPSGSSSSGETPAAARREPTPRELDAVERALDEVRGLALPRIELPPAPVAPAPPKERTGP